MAKKQRDDLVDAGSEYSFPASDPPSYMGGAAVAGPPPEDGEPPHEHVIVELTDPNEAKPAEDAPQGTDPRRSGALKNPPSEMPSGRSPVSTDTGAATDRDSERVRRRAYQIWESEGRSGNAEEHWLRAEREIRGAPQSNDRDEAQGNSQPPSEDAGKMAEQVKTAMHGRTARANPTKRVRTAGEKGAAKKTGSNAAGPNMSGSPKGKPRPPRQG
jgi:Protein of unknown function (DUF2934)